MPNHIQENSDSVKTSPPWNFNNHYGSLMDAQPLVLAGDRIVGVSGSTLFAVDLYSGNENKTKNDSGNGISYTMQEGE